MLTALKGLNSSVERRNGLNSWNLYRQVGRDLRSVHSHTHWGMWAGWVWQQQQVKFILIVSSGPTSLNKVMQDWKGSGCYSIRPSPLLSLWGTVSNSQPRRCASRSTPWHSHSFYTAGLEAGVWRRLTWEYVWECRQAGLTLSGHKKSTVQRLYRGGKECRKERFESGFKDGERSCICYLIKMSTGKTGFIVKKYI